MQVSSPLCGGDVERTVHEMAKASIAVMIGYFNIFSCRAEEIFYETYKKTADQKNSPPDINRRAEACMSRG